MDFSTLTQIWEEQFKDLSVLAENLKIFFQGVPEFFMQLGKAFSPENIARTK